VRASLSYLLTDDSDVYRSTCLRILCNLLTDGAHSPFYRGLIDKGIGKDMTANTGYDSSTEVASFGIGVQVRWLHACLAWLLGAVSVCKQADPG